MKSRKKQLQADVRLTVNEEQEHRFYNTTQRKKYFKVILLLLALFSTIVGILLTKRQRVENETVFLTELDLINPPDPNDVLQIQPANPGHLLSSEQLQNMVPGHLSNTQIDSLLACPEISIVKDKNSKSQPKKMGENFKKQLHAGISDSPKLAQSAIIRCLKHPAVGLKMFESQPKQMSLMTSGIFHSATATVNFFQDKGFYEVVAHELSHCGAAAMGVKDSQLPYSSDLFIESFPCFNENFLPQAQQELQSNILRYREKIIGLSKASIIKLAKHDHQLDQLLQSAKDFYPNFYAVIGKSVFKRLDNAHNLTRGITLFDHNLIHQLDKFTPTVVIGKDVVVPSEVINSYIKAATGNLFMIKSIDKHTLASDNLIIIIGSPLSLNPAIRAQLLVLEAEAITKYVGKFHSKAQCTELFASLISSLPDSALRTLLPKTYPVLLQIIENPIKRSSSVDRSQNERIENRIYRFS